MIGNIVLVIGGIVLIVGALLLAKHELDYRDEDKFLSLKTAAWLLPCVLGGIALVIIGGVDLMSF